MNILMEFQHCSSVHNAEIQFRKSKAVPLFYRLAIANVNILLGCQSSESSDDMDFINIFKRIQ